MAKTAFVLSGGGSKGCFQAGVLFQLLSKGIKPDVIYGTSVGAINAAGMAYLSPDELVQMWTDIKGDGDIVWPHGWRKYLYWPRMLWSGGFYSLAPLRSSLEKIIKGPPRYEALSCYVEMKSGDAVFCSNQKSSREDYIDSIMASASIPMLMEDQDYKIDGGVRHHTPLKQAVKDGAEEIYIIICRPYNIHEEPWKPSGKLPRILEVGFRAIDDIMSHEIFVNDLEWCFLYNEHSEYLKKRNIKLHLYAPDRLWMDTIDFNPDLIKQALTAGMQAKEITL